MTALIVDDDSSIRTLLRTILSRAGIHSHFAVDGEEALEKIAQENYEVVLLDIMMPKMDGYEVLRQLKQHNPHYLQRIYVLSASPGYLDDVQEYIAGVLPKPFNVSDIVSAVKSMPYRKNGGA